MTLTTVAILFGGANSEHEVSVNSARSVVSHLDPERFAPVLFGVDRRGRWHQVAAVDELETAKTGTRFPDFDATQDGIDVAFPVFHGRFGEDGTVQGMLEMSGTPYVGCGVLASALAMDKLITQRVLAAAGIPTIPSVGITEHEREDAATLVAHLEYPLFVKPNRAGSSVGASRVSTPDELPAALTLALEHDTTALVQQAVVGDEIDLGVLQAIDGSLSVGAPLRIHPTTAAFFDYEAKYTAGGAELEVPAAIAEDVAAQLAAYATQAFRALDCEGLARVDFFVSTSGEILLNEVNTLPGLTAFSQYPRMWQAVGVSYTELLSRLIDRALASHA